MKVRVVLADDHPAFALGMRFGLEAQGLDVVGVAHDGDTAVRLCSRERPDTAVFDVRMPGCDGIEACRRVVAEATVTAVVILSTFDDRATRRAAYDAGARAYFTKETPIAVIGDALGRLTSEPRLNLMVPPELPHLTEREREVLEALGRGLSNKQVAARLGVSPETVRNHCSSVYGKLGVRDRTQAVLEARRLGLVGD